MTYCQALFPYPLQSTDVDPHGPYIAAEFLREMPDTFLLGDGQSYRDHQNRMMDKNVDYRVFLRAYTSSSVSILRDSKIIVKIKLRVIML